MELLTEVEYCYVDYILFQDFLEVFFFFGWMKKEICLDAIFFNHVFNVELDEIVMVIFPWHSTSFECNKCS